MKRGGGKTEEGGDGEDGRGGRDWNGGGRRRGEMETDRLVHVRAWVRRCKTGRAEREKELLNDAL